MSSLAISGPFSGLPLGWELLFTADLLLICVLFAWTAVLFARAAAWLRSNGDERPDGEPEHDRFWVFLVPALNEETVIAATVERLLAVRADRFLIVAIDDGSDDGTARELERFANEPRVHVHSRKAPEAKLGKAAALNDVWRGLDGVLAERGVERPEVIVGIVDADGHLDPHAPRAVGNHFADPGIGGVQILVRIYNRRHLLARMQDVEFAVFGFLFQCGRSKWGTAGMGGSGQFNRLTALDAVADRTGPWRDRLTEDQDLGLRLVAAGYRSHQEMGVHIGQQGLSSLRRLLRQRIRWAQGNLECLSLASTCIRAPLPVAARIDLIVQMLMPLWQSFVGIGILAAIALWATGRAGFIDGLEPARIGALYALAFGGVLLGCVARGWMRSRTRGLFTGLVVAQVYALYSWLLWPVLAGSISRHLTGRDSWSKTEREPLAPDG